MQRSSSSSSSSSSGGGDRTSTSPEKARVSSRRFGRSGSLAGPGGVAGGAAGVAQPTGHRGAEKTPGRTRQTAVHVEMGAAAEPEDPAILVASREAFWALLQAKRASGALEASPGLGGDGGDGDVDIAVAVRVRPFNSGAEAAEAAASVESPIVAVHDGRQVVVSRANEQHMFAYDDVFDSMGGAGNPARATQQSIFEKLGYDALLLAWQGINVSIFAYGQTGSGKSFTMVGTEYQPGLVPRIADHLFDSMMRSRTVDGAEPGRGECHAFVSCVEIYNENLRDLLDGARGGSAAERRERAANGSGELRVVEDPKKGVVVEGLSAHPIESIAETMKLVDDMMENRVVAAHALNASSSRSHAVFTISFIRCLDAARGAYREARLNLVDLAGSERAKATGAEGATLREGGAINRSLTVLGRVISALSKGADVRERLHVPFRDSKLTLLLKDSLSGNVRSTMLAAISPSGENYDETLSTLRYASTCKKIRTRAVVNLDPTEALVGTLRAEVAQLRSQLLASALGPLALAGKPAAAAAAAGGADPAGSAVLAAENEALRCEVEQLRTVAVGEQERLHKMKEYIQRQHARLKDEVSKKETLALELGAANAKVEGLKRLLAAAGAHSSAQRRRPAGGADDGAEAAAAADLDEDGDEEEGASRSRSSSSDGSGDSTPAAAALAAAATAAAAVRPTPDRGRPPGFQSSNQTRQASPLRIAGRNPDVLACSAERRLSSPQRFSASAFLGSLVSSSSSGAGGDGQDRARRQSPLRVSAGERGVSARPSSPLRVSTGDKGMSARPSSPMRVSTGDKGVSARPSSLMRVSSGNKGISTRPTSPLRVSAGDKGMSARPSSPMRGSPSPALGAENQASENRGLSSRPSSPLRVSSGDKGISARPSSPLRVSAGDKGMSARPSSPMRASTGDKGVSARPSSPVRVSSGGKGVSARPSSPLRASTGTSDVYVLDTEGANSHLLGRVGRLGSALIRAASPKSRDNRASK